MRTIATVLVVLGISVAAQAMSQKERAAKGFTIRQGAAITVVDYQKGCDCFVVQIETEPGVGPNITTTQWLLEALKLPTTPDEARRHPEKLMGETVYHLQKDLSLLSPGEISRRKKVKKAKRGS